MPETPLTFVIDADEISPAKFTELLDSLIGLLREVDREISDYAEPSLTWRIASLSYHSPAAVGRVSRPRERRPCIGPQVTVTSLSGRAEIETSQRRPVAFNDAALRRVRDIAELTGNRVRSVTAHSALST